MRSVQQSYRHITQGEDMREIDPDTWLMLGVAWLHGLAVGYAIWREKKSKHEDDEE
jgi:hypothetical protein